MWFVCSKKYSPWRIVALYQFNNALSCFKMKLVEVMGIEPMSVFIKPHTTTCVSPVFYILSKDKSNLELKMTASILFELPAMHLIQKDLHG